MSETAVELETSNDSLQAQDEEDSPPVFNTYEWGQRHWEKLLDGHNADHVMQLNPSNPIFHFDPLTWKFRTDPDHAWSIPTGNRTPNREALKALRKAMEASGSLPPRHHRRHHEGETEAEKKERKARKRNLKKPSESVAATPMQMALQARGSHVGISWGGASPDKAGSTVSKVDQELKLKDQKKSKKSAKSNPTVVSQLSSTAPLPPTPAPLQIIEVTFYSVVLHWYDLTTYDDVPEEGEEGEKEEKISEDSIEESDEEGGESEDEGKRSLGEGKIEMTPKTMTLREAGERASQQAALLGDSRLVYILESREQNGESTKDWQTISVGYGSVFVHDNLRAKTTYSYRVRSMDHERGICSAWTEVLEVTTKRPPHTLQDVLIRIASNDIQGIIEILETGEVNPNAEDSIGFSPLMRAAQQDKVKLMQALIRHGADPNFQSREQRRTALMVAAFSGNHEAVKTLRLFEASYDLYDSSHLTAVHWAVDSGNMDLMEYILADGANIECADTQGWTPLHRTALVGTRTEGVCEVLIRYGAKLDRLDKDMKTPLMNATISNKGQIAQILVSRGADIFVANKDGRTVYDLACALERKGIWMLLEDIVKAQKMEISVLHGQGTKGGPAKIDRDEFENLDSFARQLAIKMREKPSIDPNRV